MSTSSFEEPPGPLLRKVLDAQAAEERLVAYPTIEAIADAVIARAIDLGDCLVWPVGFAAERVTGVVTARARGAVAVGAWGTPVDSRRLLLLTVAAVSPLELAAAAEQLRSRGAVEVHACGVDIANTDRAVGLDSYASLQLSRPAESLSLVGDAA